VFATGFVPSILYVTGLLLWWRKRASLRKRRRDNPEKGTKFRQSKGRKRNAVSVLQEY
jgi:hypothetical protein